MDSTNWNIKQTNITPSQNEVKIGEHRETKVQATANQQLKLGEDPPQPQTSITDRNIAPAIPPRADLQNSFSKATSKLEMKAKTFFGRLGKARSVLRQGNRFEKSIKNQMVKNLNDNNARYDVKGSYVQRDWDRSVRWEVQVNQDLFSSGTNKNDKPLEMIREMVDGDQGAVDRIQRFASQATLGTVLELMPEHLGKTGLQLGDDQNIKFEIQQEGDKLVMSFSSDILIADVKKDTSGEFEITGAPTPTRVGLKVEISIDQLKNPKPISDKSFSLVVQK